MYQLYNKIVIGKNVRQLIYNILLSLALFFQTSLLFSALREVKIGAISMEATHSFSWSLSQKLSEVSVLIAEAGKQNVDIVAIAEAYFKGKSYVSDAQDFGNSVILDSMKVWAKKHNINIIFQAFELLTGPTRLYNTAVLVDRNGNYVGKYRKVNLPPEEKALTPGDSFPVFELDFGKVGIQICWDGWFTEPSKTLVNNGAEIIIIPTWCNYVENLEVITAENGVPVSYAVLKFDCGPGGTSLPSSVYDHHGDPVFQNHMVGLNKIAIGTVTLGNYKNIALNKSVQTSPGTDPQNPGTNAVDGQYSTEREAPAEKQTSWKASSLPQWIEIDLEEDYEIDRVSIAQFETDGYDYQVEGKTAGESYEVLSNQFTKLETILEHGKAGSEILSSRFDTTKVRYVKLTVSSINKTDLTINEIKVFGYVEDETGIRDSDFGSRPKKFKLFPNYPNPFNSETVIQYALSEQSDIKLVVYNMQGQVVKSLANENLPAGIYNSKWDGKNQFEQLVSSGIYLCTIEFESVSGRRSFDYNKMIFMK